MLVLDGVEASQKHSIRSTGDRRLLIHFSSTCNFKIEKKNEFKCTHNCINQTSKLTSLYVLIPSIYVLPFGMITYDRQNWTEFVKFTARSFQFICIIIIIANFHGSVCQSCLLSVSERSNDFIYTKNPFDSISLKTDQMVIKIICIFFITMLLIVYKPTISKKNMINVNINTGYVNMTHHPTSA